MTLASPIAPSLDRVAWSKTLKEEAVAYPRLQDDLDADLVVVGGGLCGLNAAFQAARSGLSVVLLEAGVIGAGASGRNGGFMVPHFPGGLTPNAVSAALGAKKGAALADLVLSGAEANFRMIEELGIRCDATQNGWIQPAHSARSLAVVRGVYEGWRAHGADVSWLSAGDIASLTGAAGYVGGWTNAQGGTVNPYGLVLGLARVATAQGVRIFERSAADDFASEDGRTVVTADGHRVSGRTVIAAVNAYAGGGLAAVQRSAIPVYLFHVATKPLPERLLRTILPTRMCFTDLRKSGGFGRLDSENRLISGGAVFALGDHEAYGLRHVKRRIRELFPAMGEQDVTIETYWEGYCAITPTYLPHVQVLGKNFFAIGGFSTRGVNLAQTIGRVAGDVAAGRKSLDDIPLSVRNERTDMPYWAMKTRVARLIFPWFQAKDRLGLT